MTGAPRPQVKTAGSLSVFCPSEGGVHCPRTGKPQKIGWTSLRLPLLPELLNRFSCCFPRCQLGLEDNCRLYSTEELGWARRPEAASFGVMGWLGQHV
jgi:hypothetical protein